MRLLLLSLLLAILPLRGETPQAFSPLLSGALRKSGLPAAAASVTLPLISTFGGLAVEVSIDGHPVKLTVDTGASGSVLSPETAKRLGFKAEGTVQGARDLIGAAVAAQRVLVKRLEIGDAWTENEPLAVAKVPDGFHDGLLGVGTLVDWDVRIDPANKKLTLFPAGKAPPLEGETAIPLLCGLVNPQASATNQHGLRLMNLRVPVRVGSHELPATPDTGSGFIFALPTVLMERYAPDALKEAQPALVTAVVFSGQMKSRETKLPEFTLGPDTLHDLPTKVIDATPNTSSASQGNIGFNLLRHYVMTFCFSKGELRLKPLGTVQEITRTSTAGINLGFGDQGRIVILSAVPEGPGAKAGLRAGDELLEIEGHALKTMKPEELAAFKRLPPGTGVKVRYRRGETDPVEATLTLVAE